MKTKIIYGCMALLSLAAACSTTGMISRRGVTPSVNYLPKEQIKEAEPFRKNYIETTYRDSTVFFVPSVTHNGEEVMFVELPNIVVQAKARTVAERLGKIQLDFVVTLPKELIGTNRYVTVTPELINGYDKTILQPVTIRGGLFNRVQQRDYWQFEKFRSIYHPDSAATIRAFDYFVRFPLMDGARLDSVAIKKDTVTYYYRQEIPTDGAGKMLRIALRGSVIGLDGSAYEFQVADTLVYNISSLLTFIDNTPRFLTRVVSKYVEVKDKAYLHFRTNSNEICDTLRDNAQQLKRIISLMDETVKRKEFYIDSIVLTASASPEGTSKHNAALSEARARSLKKYLTERYKGVDTLLAVRSIGEDWTELRRLVESDTSLIRVIGL